MGPPGPGSSQYGSRYSMSRTCGPRDIISLVIPRLGDNTSRGVYPEISCVMIWFQFYAFVDFR
jgi:hypothetical protein